MVRADKQMSGAGFRQMVACGVDLPIRDGLGAASAEATQVSQRREMVWEKICTQYAGLRQQRWFASFLEARARLLGERNGTAVSECLGGGWLTIGYVTRGRERVQTGTRDEGRGGECESGGQGGGQRGGERREERSGMR